MPQENKYSGWTERERKKKVLLIIGTVLTFFSSSEAWVP